MIWELFTSTDVQCLKTDEPDEGDEEPPPCDCEESKSLSGSEKECVGVRRCVGIDDAVALASESLKRNPMQED